MSNHRHCCCNDATCGYFEIEEYLNTGHGTGCKYIGSRPPVATGCCGDNGGGDDCESVDCGINWNFAIEIMIQRTAKTTCCCDSFPAHCCQDDCGDDGIDCATTYDTQVVVIEAEGTNWIKDGTSSYIQTVTTTLGPYDSVAECCLAPNGADLAEMCTNADCMKIPQYNCDYVPHPQNPIGWQLENGLIMDYSTSKVNMDDEGLPLEVSFSMNIKPDRVECYVEKVVGPNGFDNPTQPWHDQYEAEFDLWVAGVGPGTITKAVWLPIDWPGGSFRCYCNNTTSVDGVTIPWGTPFQLGHTPVNGVDYTDGQYDWGARRPFYMTRHARCYVQGEPGYEGACGNCGEWVDIRCWLGDVYET